MRHADLGFITLIQARFYIFHAKHTQTHTQRSINLGIKSFQVISIISISFQYEYPLGCFNFFLLSFILTK